MDEEPSRREKILERFHTSLLQWLCRQNEQPLTRWFARELDSRGSLARLPIADWHVCRDALREARASRDGWPAHWDEAVARLVIATLRFSRPDGSPAGVFDASDSFAPPERVIRAWTTVAGGTEAGRRLREWQNSRKRDVDFTPEPPAWDVSRGVLSVLRDQVTGNGDFAAVDHRRSGASCVFELFGAGRSWLGPSWTIEAAPGKTTAPKPGSRISVSGAEIAEWSHRMGQAKVTQTIVLLGGRRLALLSALFETRAPLTSILSLRVSYPPSISARPLDDCRGFRLNSPARGESAQILPIGLPVRPFETEKGGLIACDQDLVLVQAPAGRRCWLPLVVSWDSARNRHAVAWRVLTVTESRKAVPPGRAFAARLSWGRRESYVIYRSFDAPASRAFLGYRTHARFLIGLFTSDGNVTPIVKID